MAYLRSKSSENRVKAGVGAKTRSAEQFFFYADFISARRGVLCIFCDTFKIRLKILYQQGFTFNVPKAVLDAIAEKLPIPTPPENGDLLLKFPVPSVIQGMFTHTYTIFNLIMIHVLVLVINSNICKCFFSF